jgi:hypothetical protein
MVTTIENGLEVIKTESEFFFVSETYPVLLPAEDEASYIPGVIKSVQELNTAKNAKEIEARPRCPAGTKYLEKHDHKAKRKIDEIMQQYNNVNPDEYKLSVDDRDLKVYTKVYTGPEKEPLIFQKCFLFFENTPSEVVFKFIDDLKFRNRWDKSMLGKVVVEEVENTKIIRGIFPGKYMVSDREFLFKTTAFYKVQQFDYFLQIAACEHPDYPEKDDLIRARILLQG